MIWITFLLLVLLVSIPALITILKAPKQAPEDIQETYDSRTKTLNFYQMQLSEIEEDYALSLLNQEQYEGAKLEVQRRMLQHARSQSTAFTNPTLFKKRHAWLLMTTIPVLTLGLYLVNGTPELPPFPLEKRIALEKNNTPDNAPLIATLREKLQTLPPESPEAFEGYVLLGQAEMRRNQIKSAIEAWQKALQAHFDPLLAAMTAEALCRQAGYVTPQAVQLFHSALEKAPKDAPWRLQAEQRISESLHH